MSHANPPTGAGGTVPQIDGNDSDHAPDSQELYLMSGGLSAGEDSNSISSAAIGPEPMPEEGDNALDPLPGLVALNDDTGELLAANAEPNTLLNQAWKHSPWLAILGTLTGHVFHTFIIIGMIAGVLTVAVMLGSAFTSSSDWIPDLGDGASFMEMRVLQLIYGIMHWLPIVLPLLGVLDLRNSRFHCNCSNAMAAGIVGFGVAIFFVLIGLYCAAAASSDRIFSTMFQSWWLRSLPVPPESCETRVAPSQRPLFQPANYHAQFARVIHGQHITDHRTPLNESFFHSIKDSPQLCASGFTGNADLYGLGIRIGFYVQLISSLISNNFLSPLRTELQSVYLLFSLVICLATFVSSFAGTCVFGIEIEILYWMYWGGFFCIFGCSPSSVRLGHTAKWIQLDWTYTILFLSHGLMVYHGIWYVWHAYDAVFARMPCGTYHFFVGPFLDPSQAFWILRDWLTILLYPIFVLSGILYPLSALLLFAEVKYAVQSSAMWQGFIKRPVRLDNEQVQNEADDIEESDGQLDQPMGSQGSLNFLWRKEVCRKALDAVYACFKRNYCRYREVHLLPSQRRGGIRLITPLETERRKYYRTKWAVLGFLCFTVTVFAIELLLRWNRVVGINSLASIGQYMALSIGCGSFFSLCWSLMQQEAERRHDFRRRQSIYHEGDDIELSSLAAAVSHAFAQPDTGLDPDIENGLSAAHGEEDVDAGDLGLSRPLSAPL